jgi:sarcosine oxidase, subunit beta
VLLERDELGSGSTCKAAGGVRAQFSDPVNIALGQRSLRAFEQFGERPGAEIDLKQHGYLFLLSDPDDVATFERNVGVQNDAGVPSRMLTAGEALELSPWISAEGLLAAAYSPTDGHCSPESVVQGYARAARSHGATIVRHCALTGIETNGGRIASVQTASGAISTSTVVAAAGAWSGAVGDMAGVELPVRPLRRQILVTEPIPNLPPAMPFTIDFSTGMYFHDEGPGLLVGMGDPDEEYGFHLQTSDRWLMRVSDVLATRVPRLTEVGVAHQWAGLYEISPDGNALVGESDTVGRFLYATGFSGHGFLQAPAIGETIRDLVLRRPPQVDVSGLSVDRFASAQARPEHNLV